MTGPWSERPDFASYACVVFDCDGVILDSNAVKTEAFRRAALPYGAVLADRFAAYHRAHGGISRYEKVDHFLAEIVPEGADGPGREAMLAAYAAAVHEGLRTCAVADGLHALRAVAPSQVWAVASGGDQAELRALFAERGLADLFDGGIYGSPDDKVAILTRELRTGRLRRPALFLGDSRYDYEAARAAGLDFVFASGWTEVEDWRAWTRENGLPSVRGVHELIVSRTGGSDDG